MFTKNQMNNDPSDLGLNSIKKRSFSFDGNQKNVYKSHQNPFYENLLFPSSSNSENKTSSIIDVDKLKSSAWKGIPFRYRPHVWRIFLDYEPANTALSASVLQHKRSDYFDCLDRVFNESQRHLWTNSQKQTETQILKDLPRTHVQLIRNEERVKLLFERVLFIWAVRHPASGYVQGMNDLLQPFFFVFLSEKLLNNQENDENPESNQLFDNIESIENLSTLNGLTEDDLNDIEADCFWCFSKLLDSIQDLFTKDQPGIYKMLSNLETVVSRVAPALAKTIKDEEIHYQEFAFRWMNCLLIREFPMKLVLKLWDNYVCDPQKISTMHVYVCAAMMELLLQPRLKGLSHADFVIRIQDPFMKQVSCGYFSSSESSSIVSPLASGSISNCASSTDLERTPPNKRIKRAQSTVINSSNSSSSINLNMNLNPKRKTCWDEQDIDMVIAQAYVYEKMFQSSTHLKSPSKSRFPL